MDPLYIVYGYRYIREVDTFSKHDNKVHLAGVVSVGTGEPAQTERKYHSGTTLKDKAKNVAHLSTLILEQGINVRIDEVDDAKLMDMIWTTHLWLDPSVVIQAGSVPTLISLFIKQIIWTPVNENLYRPSELRFSFENRRNCALYTSTRWVHSKKQQRNYIE
uniref:RibD_C domain-containing protein n=1 Tax=Angiostrongylus cantonensis TaxID=6313 RepID=A0A0K0DI83_ANGCA